MAEKHVETLEEQVKRIADAGFIVVDEAELKTFLHSCNYYRFAPYLWPFKREGLAGRTDIRRIIEVYRFDEELRTWVYHIIGGIEGYLKTQLGYYLGAQYGDVGYLEAETYNDKHNNDKFRESLNRALRENKSTIIINQKELKPGVDLPVWIVIETFSLGMTSVLYADLKVRDKKRIARGAFGTGHQQLESWLKVLAELRNKCAHYTRLYNWTFKSVPRGDMTSDYEPDGSLFAQLYCLSRLYPDPATWQRQVQALAQLLKRYNDAVVLSHMGFPKQWRVLLESGAVRYAQKSLIER